VRNAAIAVLLMTTVPIGIVALNGPRVWAWRTWGLNTSERVARAELSRPLLLPRDPSITPMQAGLAFSALSPVKTSPEFPFLAAPIAPDVSWRRATLTDDMFPGSRPNLFNGPSSQTILEAVAKGFTPKEMTYLRALAASPAWREFDMVARAPAVDFIGGRFKIPFAANATAERMPIPSYQATKEMAYASVSRAAYYMAIGQRDSAETALRAIVSFGFALVDNSTTLIDEMMGAVVIGIGRDALERYYLIAHAAQAARPDFVLGAEPDELVNFWVLTRDPRGHGPNAVRADRQTQPDFYRGASLEEVRGRLLARLADPAVHRGDRYEILRLLSASSCTNPRELLLGPRSDVTDAINNARNSLARYPSERALVDLVTQQPDYRVVRDGMDPIGKFAVSSATVAGVVLRNPRLAACARLAGPF
jgi:hypothetical protein